MTDNTKTLLHKLEIESKKIKSLTAPVKELNDIYDNSYFYMEFIEVLIRDWVYCWHVVEMSNSLYKRKIQKSIINELLDLMNYMRISKNEQMIF